MPLGEDMMDWLTGNKLDTQSRPEAIAWLSRNRNRYGAFAGNRFRTTHKALEAVRKIYAAGATRVEIAEISNEPWRTIEEGGPYAATLIITTRPDTETSVKRVVASLNPDEFNRIGQGVYRVWWD